MVDLYLDRDKHSYFYKGEKKDCVSDVLELVDVIAMKGIPIKNIEIAAERGTRVHEQTEDYEFGLIDILDDEWLQENNDIVNYVYAYINFLNEHPEKPIASEESVYSEKVGLAGTIDLVKYINGKLAIIDKKTSKTISELRSTLQLNYYRLIWNDLFPDLQIEALYILQLEDTGEKRLIPININEEKALSWLSKFNEIKGDIKL